MKLSINFWLARIIISGVLLAGVFGTATQADKREWSSIAEEELWQHRPADIFKLSDNKDSSVCRPLLASLNTSLPIVRAAGPFPLLRNKFLVNSWQHQSYNLNQSSANPRIQVWEAAYLDFDGDGSLDGLFRLRRTIRRNDYHGVWFVRSVQDQIIKSREVLEQPTARNILNENNGFPTLGHWNHIIEIVRIAKRPYAIVADAAYWTLKSKSRRPKVQLMKLATDGWESVCVFDGVIEIIRKY